MNILMITPDYPPNVFGGIGTYVDWLVDNLVRMGHRVFLIVSRADYFIDHTYTLERRHNLTIARFDVRSPTSCVYVCNTSLNYYSYKSNCNAITVVKSMDELFTGKEDFDIIHVHDHYCALIFEAAKQIFPGSAAISTIHSCRAGVTYYEDSIRRYVSQSVNHVIAVSKSVKDQMIAKYGHNLPNITVLHGAINSEMLVSQTKEGKYLTYVGRLHQIKGVDTLLYAYSRLSDFLVDAKIPPLYIAGDGPEREKLENICSALNITQKVHFLGQLDAVHVRGLLDDSKIHIVPSNYEPFGLTVLEGMARGRCVIASNVGGIPEYIQNGLNGLLFEPNDCDKLAEQLVLALTDDSLRLKLGQNALDITKKMTGEHITAEVVKVYQSVLNDFEPVPRNGS